MKKKNLVLAALVVSAGISSQPLYAQNIGSRPIENWISEQQFEAKGESRISDSDMRKVQQALKTKGFDPGHVDGKYDAQTQGALRDYQKQNNLSVTGAVDSPTAESLGVVVVFVTEQ